MLKIVEKLLMESVLELSFVIVKGNFLLEEIVNISISGVNCIVVICNRLHF